MKRFLGIINSLSGAAYWGAFFQEWISYFSTKNMSFFIKNTYFRTVFSIVLAHVRGHYCIQTLIYQHLHLFINMLYVKFTNGRFFT